MAPIRTFSEIQATEALSEWRVPLHPPVGAWRAGANGKGVLYGDEMGRVFSWMRPNDLIWNYWVNNYLMGNAPPVLDILYWNDDTTRLPGAFDAQILDVFAEKLL